MLRSVLFAALALNLASAGWVPIGPHGGHIQALAFDPQDPDVFYGATYAYPAHPFAYRSTDACASWTPLPGTFEYSHVYGMVVDPHIPDNIYACCRGFLTWRSTDAGRSWQYHDSPGNLRELVPDPFDPGVLHAAGVTLDGLPAYFLSIDTGRTWTATVVDSSPGYLAALRCDPLSLGTIYVSGDSGRVFRTVDAGRTWTGRDSGLPDDDVILSLAVNPANPAILLAGGIRDMYRSDDYGLTWRSTPGPLKVEDLRFAPSNPSVAYALAEDSSMVVWVSSDSGATWSHQSRDTAMVRARTLLVDPRDAGTAYLNCYRGVLKTTDRGDNWFYSYRGMHFAHIYTIAVNPGTQDHVLAGCDDHRLFQSFRTGDSWSLCNTFWCRENGRVGDITIGPGRTHDYIYAIEAEG